jgi:hypothetical protein
MNLPTPDGIVALLLEFVEELRGCSNYYVVLNFLKFSVLSFIVKSLWQTDLPYKENYVMYMHKICCAVITKSRELHWSVALQ